MQLRPMLVALVFGSSAAWIACSSDDGQTSGPIPRAPFDGGVDDGGSRDRDDGLPGMLAFTRGTAGRPSRIYVGTLEALRTSSSSIRVLPAPDMAVDEMPSFDVTGKRITFVRTEGAVRSIVSTDADGDARVVVMCAGACSFPQTDIDGATWFLDRTASGPERIMRVTSGSTTATRWALDLGGCRVDSMRLSLERDRVVLSLAHPARAAIDAGAAPDASDAGDPADAADAGENADAGASCDDAHAGVVVLRFDATTLAPAGKLQPYVIDGVAHAIELVRAATASSATGEIFAVVHIADQEDPRLLHARALGGTIQQLGRHDSFDVIRPAGAGKSAAFVARVHEKVCFADDCERFSVEYLHPRTEGNMISAVLYPVGVPSYIGPISWAPSAPIQP